MNPWMKWVAVIANTPPRWPSSLSLSLSRCLFRSILWFIYRWLAFMLNVDDRYACMCVCVFFLNGYSLKGYFRVICPLIITPLITIITLLITYRYWASGRWSQNRLVKSSGSSRPRSYYNGQPSPPQSLVRVIRDTRVIISFTRVYTYIYIYIYIYKRSHLNTYMHNTYVYHQVYSGTVGSERTAFWMRY